MNQPLGMVVQHFGIGHILMSHPAAAFAAADVYNVVYESIFNEPTGWFNHHVQTKGYPWTVSHLIQTETEVPITQGPCSCTDVDVCFNCLEYERLNNEYHELCLNIAAGINIDPKVWNFIGREGMAFCEFVDMDHLTVGVRPYGNFG